MPKIGPHQIPNQDIDTVLELIDEAYSRVQVSEGVLDEETFKEEVLQRRGGSYSRYRFDLQLYGFIKRSHGADEVEITSRFLNVADPVPRSARNEAIIEAVCSVEIFVEMYASEFEPGFSDRDLRVWLIQDLGVPREDAQEKSVERLRELYEPAFPYLDESNENGKSADDGENTGEADNSEVNNIPKQEQGSAQLEDPLAQDPKSEEIETIQIGDKYVCLPKDNIADEWRILKATVDAYINTMEEDYEN